MAVFWGDRLRMPKPDEYKVHAVPKEGYGRGTWQTMGTYPSRVDAQGMVDYCIESGLYTNVGIEPHSSECGIFQSHALEEVWNANQKPSGRF